MERDQRRNRGLTMREYHQVPMPHVVRVAYGNHMENQKRKEWCEFNLRELWFGYELSEGAGLTGKTPQSYGMYQFTCAHDAMMFKLTWGGTKPRPRKLP